LKWDWQTRGADLEGQLRDCRGVMLLSRYEAQPRSLREALWLGLPIICTPACNLSEAISVLGTGTIVSGDDPSEIQSAFESLPEDEGAAELARRLFDRKEVGRFLVSVLLDLGSGRRPTERDYYSQFERSARDRSI
jgi:glycosyltransferase involved in cell wall biosynthesis